MDNAAENELLSAYLDGELTAAEQARVERLLAASPPARKLLDDLRTLSTTLQSLPQEKVGEDLAPRVLRLAERRMLTETPADARKQPARLPRRAWRETLHGMLSPRALLWSGLAVAIAVMMTLWPGPDRGRQIAKAPEAPAAGAPAAGGQSENAPRARRREGPSIGAMPPGVANARRALDGAGGLNRKDNESAKWAAGQFRSTERFRKQATGDESGAAKLAPNGAAENLTPSAPPAPAKPPAAALGAGGGTGQAPLGTNGRKRAAGEDLKAEKDQFAGNASAEKKAATAAPAFGATAAADKARGQSLAKGVGASASKGAYGSLGGAAGGMPIRGTGVTDRVLVVRCDVASAAAGEHAFDKLLRSNGLAATSPAPQYAGRYGQDGYDHKLKSGEELVYVYVTATPAQLESLLAHLPADAFPAVSVEPAGGAAWQKKLMRYNRGGADGRQAKGSGGAAAAPGALPMKPAAEFAVAAAGKASQQEGTLQKGQQSAPQAEKQEAAPTAGAPRATHANAPSQAAPPAAAAAPQPAAEQQKSLQQLKRSAEQDREADLLKQESTAASQRKSTAAKAAPPVYRVLFVLRRSDSPAPSKQ